MPQISKKEYEEYIQLKQNEETKKEKLRELEQQQIEEVEDIRRTALTTASMAAVYAKKLERIHEKLSYRKVFTLSWRDEMEYLTDKFIYKKGGKFYIQRHFRDWMLKYGWKLRIVRKYGVLEITKISPR